jgi:hypothetical protein
LRSLLAEPCFLSREAQQQQPHGFHGHIVRKIIPKVEVEVITSLPSFILTPPINRFSSVSNRSSCVGFISM